VGIFICSPISAFLVVVGSISGILTCYVLGMNSDLIIGGYYTGEAAVTCLCIGGMFYVFSVRSTIYGFLAASMAVIFTATFDSFFLVWGVPVLNVGSSLVIIMFMLCQGSLFGVIAVDITKVTTPEGHLRRLLDENEEERIEEGRPSLAEQLADPDLTIAEKLVVVAKAGVELTGLDSIVPLMDPVDNSKDFPIEEEEPEPLMEEEPVPDETPEPVAPAPRPSPRSPAPAPAPAVFRGDVPVPVVAPPVESEPEEMPDFDGMLQRAMKQQQEKFDVKIEELLRHEREKSDLAQSKVRFALDESNKRHENDVKQLQDLSHKKFLELDEENMRLIELLNQRQPPNVDAFHQQINSLESDNHQLHEIIDSLQFKQMEENESMRSKLQSLQDENKILRELLENQPPPQPKPPSPKLRPKKPKPAPPPPPPEPVKEPEPEPEPVKEPEPEPEPKEQATVADLADMSSSEQKAFLDKLRAEAPPCNIPGLYIVARGKGIPDRKEVDRIVAVFRLGDDDGNNVLSKDEFLTLMKILMSSSSHRMNPMLISQYSKGFHQKRSSFVKGYTEKVIPVEEFLDIYKESVANGWIKE